MSVHDILYWFLFCALFQIVVNKHKAFVRFGLTHIIATNICIWALATVVETAEDYQTRNYVAPTPALATNGFTYNSSGKCWLLPHEQQLPWE